MIIVGAKGFAKEVLEVLHQLNQMDHLAFYDDVSDDLPDLLYGKFTVLRNEESVKEFIAKHGNSFVLGIGNPLLRKKLYDKFVNLHGSLVGSISPKAEIGNYNVSIGEGCNILPLAIISNGVSIGKGCIVYYHAMVTHDCKVGDFVEISPGAILLGNCQIGNYSQVGASSTVLPNIKIGSNVIIAAGAVVTKNVPDNCMVAGVPAIIKKQF